MTRNATTRNARTRNVASALGVTPSTVQTYRRDHRIPFDVTPGGHRRYDIDEVRTALGVGGPSALTPLVLSGLGAGAEFRRSAMVSLDAERHAVIGESIIDVPAGPDVADSRTPGLIDLIEHSRRVLVAV